MIEFEAERAKREKLRDELALAINEVKEEEARHGTAATTHEVIGMIAPVVPGFKIAEQLNKAAVEARKKEAKVNELKRKLQAEARQSNSELAGILKTLQNSHIDEDELEKTVISLEASIKTLGKVKTVFLRRYTTKVQIIV